MRQFATSLCILFLCGCATRATMNQLNVGMTRQQVFDLLGNAHTKAAHDNVEIFVFTLGDPSPFSTHTDYYVKLVDGKVTGFGDSDDFDPNK
jgi:SmpA / OmlA family